LQKFPFPEVKSDWLDFYRNYLDVFNGKAEFEIKNSEVRRVLAVIETAFKASEARMAQKFTYDEER
jgi:hypothetical protein